MLDVEYARRGDLSIAYQVLGDGPVDIVFGAGLVSHLDLMWGDPHASSFLRRLGQVGRLILFDKPGTGLSDPVSGPPTVEQRAQDFLAVLDAAGSRQAAVIGYSEAAAPAALLAASYPDRVEALVLLSGFARAVANQDWLPEREDYMENVLWKLLWHSADHWGDGSMAITLSPWMRDSPVYRRLAPSIERASASPGMARSLIHAVRRYDVLPVLDSIRAPTIVVHRKDEFVPIECGRDFAERIPGAKLTELSGDEHLPFFNGEDITDAIGAFLGNSTPHHASQGRALTTVLFTDIVDSTSTAATLGDERWGALRDHHDRTTCEEVERHGGRLIKQLGDGALATFDRPLMSIRCAGAIIERMNELGVEVRAGIHTGECDVTGDDVGGIAVHIGARIAALGATAEVLVTSTVRDLVLGSGVQFAERGVHELKGVPGEWRVLAVAADNSSDQTAVPGGRGEPAAKETMHRRDKAIVALASRTPWLTHPTLRIAGRVRTRRTAT
jgi:class 3 adenylate cyclase/pimeloyl-ACP methyl ester carboxylesterase